MQGWFDLWYKYLLKVSVNVNNNYFMTSRQILPAKANFLNLFFQFNTTLYIQFLESSNCDRQTEWL